MIQNLKSNLKKKYSYSYFNQNDIKKYFKILNKILIIKKNKTVWNFEKFSKTEKHLFQLMVKKNLNQNDKKNTISYYKKFNVHLKLKKRYDYKLKKKTEENCHPRAYLFLGINLDKKNKIKIYQTQKLNTLLKIIDISIIKIQSLNHNEIEILKKLIKKSFKLIKKF